MMRREIRFELNEGEADLTSRNIGSVVQWIGVMTQHSMQMMGDAAGQSRWNGVSRCLPEFWEPAAGE